MKTLAKVSLYILDKLESLVAQVLLACFACLLFAQIFLRESVGFLHYLNEKGWLPDSIIEWKFWDWWLSPIVYTEELSRFFFVWFVFFGASFAARLGAHNRVTVQFKLLPRVCGPILQFVADIIWVFFNLKLLQASFEFIADAKQFVQYSPSLDWPMYYIYYIFPIAFTLMTIRIIQVNIMKYVFNIEIADVDKVDSAPIADDNAAEVAS